MNPPAKPRSSPTVAVVLLSFAAAVAYKLELQPRMRRWGAKIVERTRSLPGDELIPRAGVEVTNAITVAAPPERVWPWLAQTGREGSPWPGTATVTLFEPERVLGLKGWGVFVLESAGPDRARLIVRTRIPRGPASLFYAALLEPRHFMMRRKLLLGIKARAEAADGPIAG